MTLENTGVDKELGVQDIQAIEFSKEIGGRVGDRAERVGRVVAFPLRESFMRFVEVEIVHLAVAAIDDRIDGRHGDARSGQGRGNAEHGENQNALGHLTITRLARPNAFRTIKLLAHICIKRPCRKSRTTATWPNMANFRGDWNSIPFSSPIPRTSFPIS